MAKNESTTAKKKFKVPHLFAIVMIRLAAASIMTYIIPAGVFDTDPETGRVIGENYHYVEPTPFNLWQALLKIQPSMVTASQIGMSLLHIGGIIGIFLAANAVDDLIKFSVSKPRDKKVRKSGSGSPRSFSSRPCWALLPPTTPLRPLRWWVLSLENGLSWTHHCRHGILRGLLHRVCHRPQQDRQNGPAHCRRAPVHDLVCHRLRSSGSWA